MVSTGRAKGRNERTMPLHRFISAGLVLLKPFLHSRAPKEYWQSRDWAKLEAKRIAVVACHWLGDTLWATQTVGALQRRFPRAEIHAITKPGSIDMWNGWLMPDRILAAPEVVSDSHRESVSWNGMASRAKQFRSKNFDLVIDLTGNRYSAFFCFWLKPGCTLGFDGGELGWMYSHSVVDAEKPGHHLSERPFCVIRPLMGAHPPDAPAVPRPPMPTCTFDQITREVGIKGPPFFILVPGAGWKEKEWSPDNFARAGKLLAEKGSIIVTGSPQQAALCQRVAHGITNAKVCLAPVGRVAALLQACNGVLSNDTGLAHLAAAYGRKVVVVFKDTDPALYTPLGPKGCVHVFKDYDRVEVVAAPLLG
jgi:ADP-heptose:LPS heptosyltransferase